MSKYKKKPEIVEATQWFKHGDHAEVSKMRARRDDVGWIDINPEKKVCVWEGDWIIKLKDGTYEVKKPDEFERDYKKFETAECDCVVAEYPCHYDYQSYRKSEITYLDIIDSSIEKFNYCRDCGKKIDWEKIKEELSE